MLKEAIQTHLLLAKNYYIEQLGIKAKIVFLVDIGIDIEED
jgi:hypothetical protein